MRRALAPFNLTGDLEIAAMLALTTGAVPVRGLTLGAARERMERVVERPIKAGAALAILRRLIRKGLVSRHKIKADNFWRYSSEVRLVELQEYALQRLASRLFGGDLGALIAVAKAAQSARLEPCA